MSKSLTTAYKDHIAENSTTLCAIIKIERKDGTAYRFTNHVKELSFAAEVYKPSNSFSPTDFQSSATLSVDNLDITGIISEIDDITEEDIFKEFFYDAKIWVSQVNYNDPDAGQNKILYGSLGEMTLQENKYIVEFRNLTYILTRKLADVFSKTCRVEFGSTKCGVVVEPGYWISNTEYCTGDSVSSRIYDGRKYVVTTPGTSGSYSSVNYPTYIRTDTNLISQWSLNEDPDYANVKLLMHCDGTDASTTFIDDTGKTITVVGNTQLKTGTKKIGTASAYFDGAGDYLHVPNSTDWEFGASGFTAECWVYITAWPSAGLWSAIFSFHNGSQGWRLLYDDDARLHLSTDVGGDTNGFTTANNTLSLNTWHHVAMVINTSGHSLAFIDGQLLTTDTNTTYTVPSATTFKIGSTDGSNMFHKGYIDEIRITKGTARYLSNFTPEILPFSVSTVAEDTEGTNDGTFVGTPTLYSPPLVYKSGTSIFFDRTAGEYISVPAAASINNFFASGGKTVELWFKPTGLNGDGANSGWLIAKDNSTAIYGSGKNGWILAYEGDSKRLNFAQRFDDGVSVVSAGSWTTSSGSVLDNTAYHVVLTYDASSTSNIPEIWINGEKQTLTTWATPTGGHTATSDTSCALTIGTCEPGTTTRYFDGNIDEVALYSYVMPEGTIKNHYIAGIYGDIEPVWDTTIGNTTNDNTIVWTTYDSLKKISETKSGTKFKLYIVEARDASIPTAGSIRFEEFSFFGRDGIRYYPSSCTATQGAFVGQDCSKLSDGTTTPFGSTGPTLNQFFTFTFANSIPLSYISFDLSGGDTYIVDFYLQVSYDNEATWQTIYEFTGGSPIYWDKLPDRTLTTSPGEIAVLSQTKVPTDGTIFTDMSYVVDGVLTWTSGDNTGLSMEVVSYNSTTKEMHLFKPMPYPIQFGDTYEILAGCNHLYLGSDGTTATGHCVSRYNNGINFRGEPYIPTEDVLVGGIGQTNKEPYQY